jgi:hypothetical protein
MEVHRAASRYPSPLLKCSPESALHKYKTCPTRASAHNWFLHMGMGAAISSSISLAAIKQAASRIRKVKTSKAVVSSKMGSDEIVAKAKLRAPIVKENWYRQSMRFWKF